MQLKQMGWGALVVWECELSSAGAIKQTEERVRRFLNEATISV